jgi:hypothetical protein
MILLFIMVLSPWWPLWVLGVALGFVWLFLDPWLEETDY